VLQSIIVFFKSVFIKKKKSSSDLNDEEVLNDHYSHKMELTPQKINNKLKEKQQTLKIIPPKKNNDEKTLILRQAEKLRWQRKIEENITFLNSLIEFFAEYNEEYVETSNQLIAMKEQSEGSIRILVHLSENKPYYKNTMKLIKNHTKAIYTVYLNLLEITE